MTDIGADRSGGRRIEKTRTKWLVTAGSFLVAALAAVPARAEGTSTWYGRIGPGAIAQKGLSWGPAFGFGWRYGMGALAFDGSLFNFVLTKQGSTFDNLSGSWIRAGALYYLTPLENQSLYAGAALGWGVTSAEVDSVHYSNAGLDFGLSLGFEMMRSKTMRLFVQADADLPAYMSHGYVATLGNNFVLTQDSIYTPSFSLSIGVGVGRPKEAPPPPQ